MSVHIIVKKGRQTLWHHIKHFEKKNGKLKEHTQMFEMQLNVRLANAATNTKTVQRQSDTLNLLILMALTHNDIFGLPEIKSTLHQLSDAIMFRTNNTQIATLG